MCFISYRKDRSFHFINVSIDWICHLLFFSPLESLMLNCDAFKSHNVRKWISIFCKLVSLESTGKHKRHLDGHLFLHFTNYLSSTHFILTPKHPEIQNSITKGLALIYFTPVWSLVCLFSAFLKFYSVGVFLKAQSLSLCLYSLLNKPAPTARPWWKGCLSSLVYAHQLHPSSQVLLD